MVNPFRALLGLIRHRARPSEWVDASPSFPHGFATPFETVYGMVDEVYAIRRSGDCAVVMVLDGKVARTGKQALYTIRAEITPIEEETAYGAQVWGEPKLMDVQLPLSILKQHTLPKARARVALG